MFPDFFCLVYICVSVPLGLQLYIDIVNIRRKKLIASWSRTYLPWSLKRVHENWHIWQWLFSSSFYYNSFSMSSTMTSWVLSTIQLWISLENSAFHRNWEKNRNLSMLLIKIAIMQIFYLNNYGFEKFSMMQHVISKIIE